MKEFVVLQDITKIYKMGEIEIRAADNISFSIDKGEFAEDPIGAYENKIYSKSAPMKTAVIWNEKYIDADR